MREKGIASLPVVFLGGLLLLVCPLRVLSQETANSRLDFAGEWTLNRDLSTDSRGLEDGRQGGDLAPGRGAPGGGGGLPGGITVSGLGIPSSLGGGKSTTDVERMRDQMAAAQRLLADTPASMVITVDDPRLAIEMPEGHTRTLYTDKRKWKASNGLAEVQSRWDKDRVVAETRFGSLKVIETYALSADGQLIVTARMDAPAGRGQGGDNGGKELRRVYDRIQREPQSPER